MAAPRRRLLPTLAMLLLAPAVRAEPPARIDAQSDPLPAGALARLGTTRFRADHLLDYFAVALAPDGKALAINGNQDLRILDRATGKELRILKATGFNNYSCAAYSPDGKILGAMDRPGGRMQFWNPATGEAISQVAPAAGGPAVVAHNGNAFSFSRDGKYVAVCSGNFGGNSKSSATVYAVATGEQVSRVEMLHNFNVCAFLSGDGKILVTSGQYMPQGGIEPREKQIEIDQTLELWDPATGKEVRKLRSESGGGFLNVAFSPDGKQLAAAQFASLVIFDLARGKEVRRLAGRRISGTSLAYSPDGKTLAAGWTDGVVQTWDAASGQRKGLYDVPRIPYVRLAYTSDGKLLAFGGNGQSVYVWDVPAEKSLTPTGGHQAGVTGIRFTANGKGVITASTDGTVCFWDAAGKETKRVRLGGGEAMSSRFTAWPTDGVVLSPDDKHALAMNTSGPALFELARGREVCTFSADNAAFVGGTLVGTFSSDGTLVASATQDFGTRKPVLHLFDVGTGQELRKFEGQAGNLRQLALAPDGKTVAAASHSFQRTGQVNDLHVWEAATGKSLWHVDEKQPFLLGLTFSPDGKVLAAMDAFGAVTLHEAAGGRVLRRVPARPGTTNASSLTFSPDGRLLAIASYDFNARQANVHLFEVAAGTVRHEFVGHDSPITALAFAADGKRLATGANDTTVLLWDLTGSADGETAKGKPSAEELGRLWEALTDADGRAAFKAMRRLEAAPEEAVALLAKNVKPAGAGEAGDGVAKLIAALDDDSFEQRQAAHKQLAAMGRSVEGPLKKALAAKPSAEGRRAIEDLLDRLKDKGQGPPPDLVRSLRAVEVLEDLATPNAKNVLEALAKGHAEAPLTAAAKEALGRLERARKS